MVGDGTVAAATLATSSPRKTDLREAVYAIR
jgi:hypothetical protein